MPIEEEPNRQFRFYSNILVDTDGDQVWLRHRSPSVLHGKDDYEDIHYLTWAKARIQIINNWSVVRLTQQELDGLSPEVRYHLQPPGVGPNLLAWVPSIDDLLEEEEEEEEEQEEVIELAEQEKTRKEKIHEKVVGGNMKVLDEWNPAIVEFADGSLHLVRMTQYEKPVTAEQMETFLEAQKIR